MRVRTIIAPTVEPVSLSDAKVHLRVDHADEDALISACIKAAREQAETITGRTLITTTLLLTLDAWPDSVAIELPRGPVQSVSAVAYVDVDGTVQTLLGTAYALDNAGDDSPHYLLPAYGTAWPAARDTANAVTVTYVAGYGAAGSSVPGPVRQWLLLALGEMYAHREATVTGTISTRLAFVDRLLDCARLPKF